MASEIYCGIQLTTDELHDLILFTAEYYQTVDNAALRTRHRHEYEDIYDILTVTVNKEQIVARATTIGLDHLRRFLVSSKFIRPDHPIVLVKHPDFTESRTGKQFTLGVKLMELDGNIFTNLLKEDFFNGGAMKRSWTGVQRNVKEMRDYFNASGKFKFDYNIYMLVN